MSLKEVRVDGRWSGNVYKVLRRFLTSHIGEDWDTVYSRICAVAKASTPLGREIRKAVTYEVDELSDTLHLNDYYVDDDGLLQARLPRSWKSEFRKRRDTLPIVRVYFVKDGVDLWYELVDCPDGPAASKYSKKHPLWFRFNRTHVITMMPVFEYDKATGLRGKQIGTKPVDSVNVSQHQCNHKVILVLQQVATRQHKKITAIKRFNRDDIGLTAYVAGKSPEGK